MGTAERMEAGEPPDQAGGEPDGGGAAAYQPGEDKPGLNPYQRAQARLRVDGLAYGRAVDALRLARGWSVRDLSRESGVPVSTVAKLLRGETQAPEHEVLCALAYTFGFPNPGALLGRPGTRKANHQGQAAAGPGPMTLAGLIEGLLRGVWAAQDGQSQTAAKHAILEEHIGQAAGLLRAAQTTPHPILAVGVVVLNEPRTLG